MKCTNKMKTAKRNLFPGIGMCLMAAALAGCGNKTFDMAYTPDYPVSSYRMDISEERDGIAAPFAKDLCVADGDVPADVDMSQAGAAALFSLDDCSTLYAMNIHEQMAPASLTKIMTALTALKHSPPEQVLTASANVKITESGAQKCGLKEGDKMTLEQALHALLIYSANDAAVLVAEGVAGSVEAFCGLMNQEAAALGATGSHFVNPHGLTADGHYVTAYDMYLIFNEALKYKMIEDIISLPSYTTVYQDKNGKDKELKIESTNLYLQGQKETPGFVKVIGGKTGTTNAAKNCLILLSRGPSEKSYISVILRSESRETLYGEMSDLLEEIQN